MATLRPITRPQANAGIASCNADSEHYNLSYGDWVACCTDDASGNATCIVCDSDENCSIYEEFRPGHSGVQGVLELMKLSRSLKLAPPMED